MCFIVLSYSEAGVLKASLLKIGKKYMKPIHWKGDDQQDLKIFQATATKLKLPSGSNIYQLWNDRGQQ